MLTRRGLAAFQLSEELLFLVLQFNEAEREACGVGDSTPSPVASINDCWRSRRNPSVKNSTKESVLYLKCLYGMAVKR